MLFFPLFNKIFTLYTESTFGGSSQTSVWYKCIPHVASYSSLNEISLVSEIWLYFVYVVKLQFKKSPLHSVSEFINNFTEFTEIVFKI